MIQINFIMGIFVHLKLSISEWSGTHQLTKHFEIFFLPVDILNFLPHLKYLEYVEALYCKSKCDGMPGAMAAAHQILSEMN